MDAPARPRSRRKSKPVSDAALVTRAAPPSPHNLEILRLIDEGTASKTGTEFFRALVRCVADALESRYAFVSRFCDEYRNVHVIALWTGSELQEDFRYPLQGSPCERVLGGEIVAINSGVVAMFPAEEEDLRRMSAEAYLAIPLRNPAGRVLGHLAVIATEAKDWRERDFGILRIFAARATAEIERQAAEQELRDANTELAHRVELEQLITSISTRLISVAAPDLQAAVEQSLGDFATAIGADRGMLYLLDDAGDTATLTHEWVRGDTPSLREVAGVIDRATAPGVLDHFLQRRTLNCSGTDELPRAIAALGPRLRGGQPMSRIAVPLVCAERVRGILSFHAIVTERRWPAEDLRLAGLLGEIIANANVRDETEAALARALDAAESASRAKSEFLASMSHELRTPLNGILGYAQLLRRDPGLNPHHAASAAAIERCGDHLLTLISDVLDLAKIEAGRLELVPLDFELDPFLRDLADVARVRALQAGLAFSLEVSTGLPIAVCADERKLRQVLLNLLGNAVKFTPHGSVRLRVAAHGAATGRTRLRFEVEDTGIGIAGADVERIFDPFQQLAQAGRHVEGTGLGLAISRRLVDLFGGSLELRSQPGAGSTFAVEVEVELADGATVASIDRRSPDISGYAGRRRRVLVVDDEHDNRAILCHLLASIGIDVLEAENGLDAVAVARREKPDGVMMDLVMPVLDGFEAIRQLRADASLGTLRIIALSASAFDTTRAQSVAAGCDAFLTKPVRFDEALQVLGRELDLQWLYGSGDATALPASARKATGPVESAAVTELAMLPPTLARELHELACAGDVRALEQRLASARTAGTIGRGVLDQLDALARTYDMRGLRSVLQPRGEAAT
jgi:signal transduction histidine kinase/DNA-binding NarL/FixJ family response regulator